LVALQVPTLVANFRNLATKRTWKNLEVLVFLSANSTRQILATKRTWKNLEVLVFLSANSTRKILFSAKF
jgi:hypothetical protein